LVVGAANTAISYVVYLLLLHFLDYRIAYTLAYIAGLVSGYFGHARLVFGATPGTRSAAAYLVIYAAMYLTSLLLLYVVVDLASVPKPFAMLVVLLVTVPASFLLLRRGFSPPAAPAATTTADDPIRERR
jgi:putative flippase GtrA